MLFISAFSAAAAYFGFVIVSLTGRSRADLGRSADLSIVAVA